MEDLTNWPKKSGKYTIVQMEIDRTPCVRFSGYGHSSTIQMAARELQREFPVSQDFGGHDSPALESDWYKVLGAGMAEVDIEQKSAFFFGRSFGYGIGISKKHLEDMKSIHSEWEIKF